MKDIAKFAGTTLLLLLTLTLVSLVFIQSFMGDYEWLNIALTVVYSLAVLAAMVDAETGEYDPQSVIEITEEEDLDLEILNMKRRSTVLSGLYALDDYGSGYSKEGNLITLDPDFIKIDISIIRGIESDPDKQEVVRNIVSYAHQRGMQIVAEGIETAAELRTSRALGADLFQGYFLSRPGAVPSAIAAPAQEILREFPNGAEEHR